MKVNKNDKDVSGQFSLTQEQLDKTENYILYGIPAKDGKSGSYPYFFNCRIREAQFDLIHGIRERLPGWWKSNAALQRAIVAAGTYVILCYVEGNTSIDDLSEILGDMNFISKHQRIKALKEEVANIREEIVKSDLPSKTKLSVLEFTDGIEAKISRALK